MENIYQAIVQEFPHITVSKGKLLAPLTTLKIGGPADIFIQVDSYPSFLKLLKFLSKIYKNSEVNNFSARSERVTRSGQPEGSEYCKNSFTNQPFITILGNGSNVLISDAGIKGIVIQNTSTKIKILSTIKSPSTFTKTYAQRMENEPDKYLDFTKIDYDESGFPQVKVQISASTPLPFAINYLLDHGVTGLQWFAYIPGTIGGAIVHNAHGGNYNLSDYLENVKVFDLSTGKTTIYSKKELPWQYEKSYFLNHPEMIILSANFNLFQGDTSRAAHSRDAWIAQKSKVQPMNSAGSVFANPSLDICQKVWGEQKSTGWIIDHELNLKGTKIGGAQISEKHANFIVNTGNATAKDYFDLVNLIKKKVQDKFGFDLHLEVKLLGQF